MRAAEKHVVMLILCHFSCSDDTRRMNRMRANHRHSQYLDATIFMYSVTIPYFSPLDALLCVRKSSGLAYSDRRPPSGSPSISGVALCLISWCCCTKTERDTNLLRNSGRYCITSRYWISGRLTGTHVVVLEGL
ncbi:hypothetical protein BKA64DRAFT_186793 [Cadophora sp. MPI-SDFR-AT-0126]|nr:hypothetical protein BKA64DRAFT_186793 [Leotiomycetes sp. MPI-SDFR-AT-0126]